MKEPQKVMCGKCKKAQQPATSYCRDCGEFICTICKTVHSNWDDFTEHEVLALEQLESKMKLFDTLKKVVFFCTLHKGKELELYCETCEELICTHCTVKKHKDHQYDLISDRFEKHKAEMEASLDPVESQLGVANKALEQIDLRSVDINDQRVVTKTEMKSAFRQLHQLLEAREVELNGKIDEIANQKLKNLTAQKDEVETVQTQLASCLSFVRESLRTGSQGEVMKMKKTVMKQIKEMTDNFKLAPCEVANLKFVPSPQLAQACEQFGEVYARSVSPEKCYATGEGLVSVRVSERATAVIHIVDDKKACAAPVEAVKCELVSVTNDRKMKCSIKAKEVGQYEISYQATSRGRHQLHIKVEGEHIKGSPFNVTVKIPVKKLGIPIKAISGLNCPWGVAVNQRGEIIVAECNGHCISTFSPTGEKLRSFGSQGSGPGQFNAPRGVVVDDDDNILVADSSKQIQKFTRSGKYLTSSVSLRDNNLNYGFGIKIHSNRKIFVANYADHSIAIYNPDLTFHHKMVGTHDIYDIAFDSVGNVYVGEKYCNNGIQVFTAEGQYLRKFGSKGKGHGQLDFPSAITIDNEDTIYVTEQSNHRVSIFKTDGTFLTSFGSQGDGPGQFSSPNGIAVDKDGFVYVSDYSNGRVQIF